MTPIHSLKRIGILLSVACAACGPVADFAYQASGAATAAANNACAGERVRANLVFAEETHICISDTDFNTMRLVKVVLREPQTRPDWRQRLALERLGWMGQYDDVTWGLTSSGEITFLTQAPFLEVGDAKIAISEGFSGCLGTDDLFVEARPTNSPNCELRFMAARSHDD